MDGGIDLEKLGDMTTLDEGAGKSSKEKHKDGSAPEKVDWDEEERKIEEAELEYMKKVLRKFDFHGTTLHDVLE